MNNKVFVVVILTLAVAGGIFFLFQKQSNNSVDSENPNTGIQEIPTLEVETPKTPVKISRKITYLGRLEEAQKLMDHEYYSLAAAELAEAMKQKPDLLKPYVLLGEVYLRTGDVWKLDNLIKEMENKFPQSSETLILKTRQFITARKFGEVLQTLQSQESLPPELLFYEAILLALQNDHEGAKEIIDLIDDFPVKKTEFKVTPEGAIEDNPEPYVDDILNKKVNDIENIYLEFEELAEWKNAHLFAEFSKALSQNNEGLLAREFADVAIKEDVKYIDGWLLRGYANLILLEYGPAEADFRQAYELDPIRPETQYFLALALYEQDKHDEAALFFEKALEYEFEFSEEVRWKLLDIFAKQKKYEQVINLYRELLDGNTDSEKFVSAIHTAVDILRKPEIGLEFSEVLMASQPNDPFSINLHAWALIANKRFVEAKAALTKATKIDPSNPRTQLNLGLLYEEQNQTDLAKKHYKIAYETGRESPEYTSVVNLAVEKYNQLLEAENPTTPEVSTNPEHSP